MYTVYAVSCIRCTTLVHVYTLYCLFLIDWRPLYGTMRDRCIASFLLTGPTGGIGGSLFSYRWWVPSDSTDPPTPGFSAGFAAPRVWGLAVLISIRRGLRGCARDLRSRCAESSAAARAAAKRRPRRRPAAAMGSHYGACELCSFYSDLCTVHEIEYRAAGIPPGWVEDGQDGERTVVNAEWRSA